jgi:tRNA nucleotidyltransferase (CCA-adding enzyme)
MSFNLINAIESRDKTESIDKFITRLDDEGLIAKYLPEIDALKTCQQGFPYHLEGDVFTHTVMVCGNLPDNASTELILAAIFHDTGKPATRKLKREGNITKATFHGHEKLSAEITRKRLEDYNADDELIDNTCWLVANHMMPKLIPEMRAAKIRKLMSHPMSGDLIQLGKADMFGAIAIEEVQSRKEESFAGILEKIDLIMPGNK